MLLRMIQERNWDAMMLANALSPGDNKVALLSRPRVSKGQIQGPGVVGISLNCSLMLTGGVMLASIR